MNHDEWQAQVIDAARIFGWRHLHVRKSIGRRGGARGWQTTTNVRGWPDLFLWHPDGGFGAIECKVGRDTPTVDQSRVLEELLAAGARFARVAYPTHLEELVALFNTRRKGTG